MKKKIIARIRGGLGNQLFIIAYALYLKSVMSEAEIYADIREYETYKVRKYELDKLVLSEYLKEYYPKDDKKSVYYSFWMIILHIRMYILSHLRLPFVNKKKTELRTGVFYNTSIFENGEIQHDKIYVYGYFVDVKPLLLIRDSLINLFEISTPTDTYKKFLGEINQSVHPIAISMRFGNDYVQNNWPICGKEYYSKALEMIETDNSTLFVFSDVLDRAKELFQDKRNVIFVENCSPTEQLSLMMKCDDYVISNSTFSWWGAFLGHMQNRVICSPKKWHNGNTIDSKLYFENMVIIESEE